MDARQLAAARLRDDLALSVVSAVLLALVAGGVAGLLTLDEQTRDGAVRTRVGQLAPDRASLTVQVPGEQEVDDLAGGELDHAVRDDLRRAYGDLPVTTTAAARSQRPVVAPVAEGATSLVLLVAQDLDDRADLVDGGWPQGPDEASLQADAAAALGVGAGDRVQVEGEDGAPVEVLVTGTWRVADDAAALVGGEPLLLTGRQSTSAVGPLVPADPALLGPAVRTWWTAPRPADLDLDTARRLPAATRAAVATIDRDPRLPAARTSTALDEELTAVAREAGAAGATGRVVLLLVALVSLTAVLVVSSLLVQRRAGHTALLRARGASWPQVVASTLLETAVVVLPSLLLAVVVAVLAPGTGAALAVAAVVAAVVLALPAVLAARRWEAVRQQASGRRLGAARAGGELVVVAGAVLAQWQLRRQDGAAALVDGGSPDGGLLDRADLVVVAAPVLTVLAGALVAARLVAPAAALVARALRRRRDLPALMAAWQTSRAPGPHAVAVLLVVVLVATGVLLVGSAATREAELARVAERQVGADLLVTTDRPVGASGPESVAVATALADADGVADVLASRVDEASTPAGEVAFVQLASSPVADLPLSVGGGPAEVTWTASATASSTVPPAVVLGPGETFEPVPPLVQARAGALWLSGSGYPLRTDLGAVEVQTVLDTAVASPPLAATADLPPPPGGDDDGWQLVALDVDLGPSGPVEVRVRVEVTGVRSGAGDPVDGAGAAWETGAGASVLADVLGGPLPGVDVVVPALSGPTAVRLQQAAVQDATSGRLPVRVTPGLLRAAGAEVGGPLLVRRVQALQTEVTATTAPVAGVEGEAVVADLRTVAMVDLAAGRDPRAPTRWSVTLAAAPGTDGRDPGPATDAATSTSLHVEVLDRDRLLADLAADPVGVGAVRTGLLGGGVVLLLAVAGLLAGGTALARGRLRDDTVLAVLGADRGQQRRADLVRTTLVGALAVAAGLVTGVVVLVLSGPALVGDPTRVGRAAGVTAVVPVLPVLVVAAAGALLAALPALARDPRGRRSVAARMRLEEVG